MAAKNPQKEYMINQPGEKPYDEARRAAADLCRLARMWVSIAESNEEAQNPTVEIHLDEETGDEIWIERPDLPGQQRATDESVRAEVRAHWVVWIKGVQRLKEAFAGVVDSDADAAKAEARFALMQLIRIFYPPLFLVHDEEPGDQLLRGAGPITCRPGKTSRLRREHIDKINEPLADFSDLMVTYDTRTDVQHSGMDGEDSRWTVEKLCKRIKRGKTTLSKWRDAATPPVAPRVRHQSFLFEELLLIADSAERGNDQPAARTLREIIANREHPS